MSDFWFKTFFLFCLDCILTVLSCKKVESHVNIQKKKKPYTVSSLKSTLKNEE